MSTDLLAFDPLPANLIGTGQVALAVPGPPEKPYRATLGGAALLNVGTTSGTVAAGDDPRFTQSGNSSGAAGPVAPVQVTSAGSSGSPNAIANTNGLLVRVAVSPAAPSFFALPGAATVGTLITIKDELKNSDLNPITVSAPSGTVDGGASLVISDPGASVQFQLVAAGTWESVGGVAPPATINGLLDFLLTFGVPGKPAASQKMGIVPLTRAITLPTSASFAAATATYASANATAATAFVLSFVRAGVSTPIGTYTVGAGSTAGAWSALTVPTLQAGDVLILTAPATPDTTLADFVLVLQATKQ